MDTLKKKEELERQLELRRQKLAELRKAREQRQAAMGTSGLAPLPTNSIRSISKTPGEDVDMKPRVRAREDVDVDALVESLVGVKVEATKESSPEPITVLPKAEPAMEEPKSKICYDKNIQTMGEEDDTPLIHRLFENPKSKPRKSLIMEPIVEKKDVPMETSQPEQIDQVLPLSEAALNQILNNDAYREFIDMAARFVERALMEDLDPLKDYTLADDVQESSMDSMGTIKRTRTFEDSELTLGRRVLHVAWSPKHSELVAASYSRNMVATSEGQVLIWNLNMPKRPEYILKAPTDVTFVTFSAFHPHYIAGGTKNGQILLWDLRQVVKSGGYPTSSTPCASVGHCHAISGMKILGTPNSNALITVSTDGTMCAWQLEMLAQPLESLELLFHAHALTDEVAVTSFAFPETDSTTFWIGTEEGGVYQAYRNDRAGSKAGIDANARYKHHTGIVTGIDFHPVMGANTFGDLFLTSSVDWTVQLWRAKSLSKTSNSNSTLTPILSFENAEDFVMDVKWSPTHPALFACVDVGGKLALYHLNRQTHLPIASVDFNESGRNAELNKLAWDREGKHLAVACMDGRICVVNLGELAQPQSEEWTLMQKTLAKLDTGKA